MWKFKKKECNHDTDYRSRTYLLDDGTPMVEFECYKCGWKDSGHVYADSSTYKQRLIVKEKGIIIINEPGKWNRNK